MTTAELSPGHANAFMERYARTFDECNWPEFISLFNEPALTVRGDGSVKLLSSHSDALSFFQGVSDGWRSEGYAWFSTSDLEVTALGSRSGLLTWNWHMHRADGTVIKQWRQSYQVIVVVSEWRVLTSTFQAP
jgi:hypothetical protein